ncbi:MAG: M48 family metalloprotease [Pseudonocardiaceae bacterium]
MTRGLLSMLDGDERRVVLAHERAHLQGKHHWLRGAAHLLVVAGLTSPPAYTPRIIQRAF